MTVDRGNGTWFSVNSNSNPLFIYFETKSNGVCVKTENFTIQPCQSKFTFWKLKRNKNFGELIRIFQTSLNPKEIWLKLKRSLASRNFNSFSVSNLNLHPNQKLFHISHSIRVQSLVNFGAPEGGGVHNL
jgi:hypothetical protein